MLTTNKKCNDAFPSELREAKSPTNGYLIGTPSSGERGQPNRASRDYVNGNVTRSPARAQRLTAQTKMSTAPCECFSEVEEEKSCRY